MYEFVWSEFCDWYIEMSKSQILNPKSETNSKSQITNSQTTLKVLRHVLVNSLKLLHPFMPFETEELFKKLSDEGTIMLTAWPKADVSVIDEKIEKKMKLVFEVIRAIRNLRADMNIQSGKPIEVLIEAGDLTAGLKDAEEYIKMLIRAEKVSIERFGIKAPVKSAKISVGKIDINIPLEGLIDFEKEAARTQKNIGERGEDPVHSYAQQVEDMLGVAVQRLRFHRWQQRTPGLRQVQ
ncbi:MAG: class I tRNA ligase family protein, partial [Candidatus Margulisiibacteriota bacterium]